MGRPNVAGEYRVVSRQGVDRIGDLLGVDQPFARRARGELVELLARLRIMAPRFREMGVVLFLLEQRRQGLERGAHAADKSEIDGRPPPEILRPDVDLRDASAVSARIELTIGKIRAEH